MRLSLRISRGDLRGGWHHGDDIIVPAWLKPAGQYSISAINSGKRSRRQIFTVSIIGRGRRWLSGFQLIRLPLYATQENMVKWDVLCFAGGGQHRFAAEFDKCVGHTL